MVWASSGVEVIQFRYSKIAIEGGAGPCAAANALLRTNCWSLIHSARHQRNGGRDSERQFGGGKMLLSTSIEGC